MKRSSIYTIFSSFLLVLFSASLMVSTLHSHNHIEWHHSKKHADTGHCLTVDSTVCPICAYLFKTKTSAGTDTGHPFNGFELVDEQSIQIPTDVYAPSLPGRSPPFIV